MRGLGMSRARVFIHEQNSVPGKLNQLMGRRADKVLLTFPETKGFFPENGEVVGYPVRHSVTSMLSSDRGKAMPLTIPEGRRVVFAFGGSQGARTINRALVDALTYLIPRRNDVFVIHGVGLMKTPEYHAWDDTSERLQRAYNEQEREQINSFYYAQDYFHNIGDIYAVSDLIVCRGGAGSLNEISAMGKSALIIPKANLPGNHQVMNARAMKRAGGAEVIFEDTVKDGGKLLEEVGGQELAIKILSLLDDQPRLEEMGKCSRAFMNHYAAERIAAEIIGGPLTKSLPNDISAKDLDPLLSDNELLVQLRSAWQKDQRQYEPRKIIVDADDLDYYRHRAASLLTSPSWPERNLGVKLIGLLKHEEKLSSLLHLLADHTPASRLQRFLGGDYRQVGFIRRNALMSLQILNTWGPEVEARVFEALDDGYYEVRAQAARTMGHCAEELLQKQAVTEKLLSLLKDRSFEVVREVVLALGTVGGDREVAKALLGLKEHHYWQVREAALRAVTMLVERGIITDRDWLLEETSRFILTTTDFRSYFDIKETYRKLHTLCKGESDQEQSS
jgi:UDP-N-acetylglucosamine--N-acetylmuramyl-(pentapeptide) pyrophosphoryl-undecaprenol N-acetylglucosamine transferase